MTGMSAMPDSPAAISAPENGPPVPGVAEAFDIGLEKTRLLFRNAGHGGLNLVYRRPDGNIGWVDPTPNA